MNRGDGLKNVCAALIGCGVLLVAIAPRIARADEASSATPTPARKLQGEAEIDRLRAEKERAVTEARAGVATVETSLVDIKKIAIDFNAKRETLDRLEKETAPASDERTQRIRELRDELVDLRKRALAIDPKFSVDAADMNPAIGNVDARLEDAKKVLAAREREKAALEEEIRKVLEAPRIQSRMHYARLARCKTAFCFGKDGTEYAFEPMLELPIGTSFSIGGGALAKFNNATELSIQFSAGLRFWLLHDMVSISMFFAKPIYSGDVKVLVPGSDYEHPTTSIRRIGPSFAFGFIGDIIFVGGGYDQLRNGSSAASSDPNYEPNQVLSRAVTITVGLAPFAAIRNGAGALMGGR